MSDFFRRASDAFNRQRQGSADSTGAPSSPNAAKSPEEPTKQRTGSVQSESHVNEAFAGTATSDVPQPKRYPWGWKHQQGDASGKSKRDPGLNDDFDWIFAS
ncbi:uncharacterized protein N7469_009521 [Penicillium citrinum]|uniref:Uncharacterized protein n=2 Tax=Penicillium TaxID=5073 RepID=A0A9W9NIK5_PENCI|nr:uncharacterized protein N7469_009521 [Penicillium citrinum]KAJ5220634.1 hypothetical protein N7469_009521 [Penicillium citrinum]KAJ5595647.1 hypothetical protein N7450_002105 [Penicillium hetheringtonii]